MIKTRIIEIKFEGIDDWNRPVFKSTKSKHRFGDVNNLFSYNEFKENKIIEQYKNNPNDYLVYFGQSFNCEPNGGLQEDIKLVIIE